MKNLNQNSNAHINLLLGLYKQEIYFSTKQLLSSG